MILGFHDMAEALEGYWRANISSDGGLALVGLNGILLIPIIFAMFFYPVAMLIGIGVALALAVVGYEVIRFSRATTRTPSGIADGPPILKVSGYTPSNSRPDSTQA